MNQEGDQGIILDVDIVDPSKREKQMDGEGFKEGKGKTKEGLKEFELNDQKAKDKPCLTNYLYMSKILEKKDRFHKYFIKNKRC